MSFNIQETIIGKIGVKSKTCITGYAFDPASSLPVVIKIFIRDKEIGRQIAQKHRRQLKVEKTHKTGDCGFYFKLNLDPKITLREIRVLAGVSNTILRREFKDRKRKVQVNE